MLKFPSKKKSLESTPTDCSIRTHGSKTALQLAKTMATSMLKCQIEKKIGWPHENVLRLLLRRRLRVFSTWTRWRPSETPWRRRPHYHRQHAIKKKSDKIPNMFLLSRSPVIWRMTRIPSHFRSLKLIQGQQKKMSWMTVGSAHQSLKLSKLITVLTKKNMRGNARVSSINVSL